VLVGGVRLGCCSRRVRVCVGVGGGVLCRCVCVCDLLIFLQGVGGRAADAVGWFDGLTPPHTVRHPHRYRPFWLYLDAEVLVLSSGIPSSGLCFCWLPIFVVIQLPPTRAQLLLLCWCGLSRAGFLSFPASFPCVFL